ncbi:4-(cytidine 5'-diphospho)-2-C-methyl-D-erythritol kinase [Nostoc sp. CHAB 5715]|uniref:4-(cytidine 5'-diphospho)-2-C-methyl-D-erythritol kinase n=1 Tax=Nostoc sp. CHAB 5715 TaxID=2780400 RepID=UPI001E526F8C|nr:4-(cytidine 5'-diphospho)-2-C-methyl-D-erythritol kinase [Nostoc sp. CHAB 5715]MCC5624851.1 4-(cytidine 5'-diphospho)-2-C-methyl-D-erythritol kinase [Nostoc sp. CHAB 5715]
MRSYSLIASAKINLYLEIIRDRPDGYHDLLMVLQSIDLADQIDLCPLGTDAIHLHCDHPEVPQDHRNLVYKAAALMAEKFPDAFAKYGGVNITIHKRIPVGAGLAGGSTNAAAVLVGLNLMWELGLNQRQLQYLGSLLGSDVPFCIAGGTMLATGRGEFLTPLPAIDNFYVVLAKYRSLSVSTAWAYQTYRHQYLRSDVLNASAIGHSKQRAYSGQIVSAITRQNEKQICQLLHNDLERVVLPKYPQVQRLQEEFQRLGCAGMMSGSGPTVFALTKSQQEAQQVLESVKRAIPDPDLDLWVSKFTRSSICVASSN